MGRAPEVCPNCGADVPRNARACPECGADEQTGWSETAQSGGLDLPDPDFNYAAYVEREFGGGGPKPPGIRWLWWIAGVLALVAFVVLWVL